MALDLGTTHLESSLVDLQTGDLLATAHCANGQIEFGDETCGEVEYVLLIENPDTIYVGVGSDHTDRHLEGTDIPRAKQIFPNIISRRIWPLAEVMDHWDDLAIEARVVKKGKEILYQQGLLALIIITDIHGLVAATLFSCRKTFD